MNAYDISIGILDFALQAGGAPDQWHIEITSTPPLASARRQGASYLVKADSELDAVIILGSLIGQEFRGNLPKGKAEGYFIYCHKNASLLKK